MKIGMLIAAVGLLFAIEVQAAEPAPKASGHEQIKKMLERVAPGQTPDAIRTSPVPGIFEVAFGAQLLYVTADGRYLLTGDLVDLQSRTNLSERQRATARVGIIEKAGESSMIVYNPKGEAKHTVTIFTDIDCGYCRKLHAGMQEMNDLGIRVRYLSYPRAGIGSSSYDKAVSVWCAKDRNKAMDAAKAEQAIEQATCESNPVRQHLALGEQLGVNGTPALVLDDGRMVPGYLPPKRLLEVLEGR